ncbi:MAG: ABC transporter substrate-binding protein [Reyranellaceae bacterium]
MDFRKLIAGAALALGVALPATASSQTLNVMRVLDSFTYDPQRATAAAASEIAFLLGDTLVALDFDMKTIKPLLAKSWKVSDDGKTYTFDLRDDVTFCSGKKMTADDVVYSFNRMLDTEVKKPSRQKMGKVKAIRATGPHQVVYELEKPYNELLYTLTLMHGTVLNKENVETLGKDFGVKGFDGTGPFCWQSWTPRNEMTIVRHDAYKWGPPIYDNRGPAKVEKIVWKIVPEDASRMAAILSGQGDLTYSVPLWSVAELRKSPNVQVIAPKNYFRTCFIGNKITRDLMKDLAVRQAMNLAINREQIAKQIFFGNALPAPAYLHPDTPDFATATQNTPLGKYNPAEAKKLLDAAGWKPGADGIRVKDGVRLNPVLYILNTGSNPQVATAVQGFLRDIGIDLKIEAFDATAYFTKIATQEFDMFQLCNPYASAGDVLNVYWRSQNRPIPNRMNWIDADTDAWLDAGLQASDPKVRAENYAKVQDRIVANALWVPLVHDTVFMAANKKVKNAKPHAIFTSLLYKGLDVSF